MITERKSINSGVAKFRIGEAVRHRLFDFRGVVYDVDPVFDNTDEWYENIPADVRPRKNQPFYHLFAETVEQAPYIAYVSQQNLISDEDPEPIAHPDMEEYFEGFDEGLYIPKHKTN